MKPTTINLLTREGMVTVTFYVELQAAHYEELHEVARMASETKESLCEQLKSLSHKWRSEVVIDNC